MSTSPNPLWFGTPDKPLFGWVHLPKGPDRGGAVVLCPPLYREGLPAQFTYLTMARTLSLAGIHVIRFDYEGTGDSAGSAAGPEDVEALLESISQAVLLARQYTGGPIALGGLRMGGLLAAIAAEQRRDVDALMLWDPCLTGRSFIRHQQATYSINFSSRGPASGLEFPGYSVTPEMMEGLGALTLPSTLCARSALLLARPGVKLPHLDLDLALQRVSGTGGGITVERFDMEEHDQFLNVDPTECREPTKVITTAVNWLADTVEALSALDGLAPVSAKGAFMTRNAAEPAAIAVEVDGVDAVVSERTLGLGPLGLFSIETVPISREREPLHMADDHPVVIFLPSGADNHSGPNRMWVRLAREWAAHGFRSVRVDLSGLGESPTRPGQADQVVGPPEAFDDVLDVAGAVGANARNVILVGLCSGAYQGLDSAFELRPRGVLGVNPHLRFEPPEVAGGGHLSPRRTVCDPRTPRINRLRRNSSLAPIVKIGVTLRRKRNAKRDRVRFETWHRKLADLGVHAYFVCGDEEAKILMGASSSSGPAWLPTGGLRIDVVKDLDHALLVEADRRAAECLLTDALISIAAKDPPGGLSLSDHRVLGSG